MEEIAKTAFKHFNAKVLEYPFRVFIRVNDEIPLDYLDWDNTVTWDKVDAYIMTVFDIHPETMKTIEHKEVRNLAIKMIEKALLSDDSFLDSINEMYRTILMYKTGITEGVIPLRGKNYILSIVEDSKEDVNLVGNVLEVRSQLERSRIVLLGWLKAQAIKDFIKYSKYFAKRLEKLGDAYIKKTSKLHDKLSFDDKEGIDEYVNTTDFIDRDGNFIANNFKQLTLKAQGYEKRIANIVKVKLLSDYDPEVKNLGGISIKDHYHEKGYQLLKYNWRYVMAPDYVIKELCAHEVAHIAVLGHEERFWNLLEKLYPDYRKSRAWSRNRKNLFRLNNILPVRPRYDKLIKNKRTGMSQYIR